VLCCREGGNQLRQFHEGEQWSMTKGQASSESKELPSPMSVERTKRSSVSLRDMAPSCAMAVRWSKAWSLSVK
jgi:hypothetical protein